MRDIIKILKITILIFNTLEEDNCMGYIYGYARVSTKTQRLARQIDNISAAYPEVSHIFTEKYTGTSVEGRTEWQKLFKVAVNGDTIIFDSVSRMSRNAQEGVKDYFALYDRGVKLIFLKEGYINTEVYKSAFEQSISATGNDIADIYIEATNKVIKLLAEKQIQRAFEEAEKEVNDLHRRVSEGIRTTQAKNLLLPEEEHKQIGRKKGEKNIIKKKDPAKQQIIKYSKWFEGQLTDKDTMKLVGLSRNTYYKYKKEIYENKNK